MSRAPSVARRRLFGLVPGLLIATMGAAAACKKASEPLPKLGEVGAFSLLDQRGRPFGSSNVRGKPWVAAFFFTRCPSICPRITQRMRQLQIDAKQSAPRLSLLSFSVDPDNDTPQVLAEYGKRYGADFSNWSFLTGELGVVKQTVIGGFKLALDGKADPNAENGGIIHGSHLVLVDSGLVIRGYYRTDDEDDMKQLLVDAARL